MGFTNRTIWTRTLLLMLVLVVGLGSAASADEPITFADFSWDSVQVHNRIAAFIIEHGYGYETDYIFGESIPLLQGLRRGDVQIAMELWYDNLIEAYDDAIDAGDVVTVGYTFPDAVQGWYVPTYLIEGDPERNIEPTAPDLRSVEDLKQYAELFNEDPRQPEKGRFYNAPTGWVAHDINNAKIEAYSLEDYFESFSPGSQAGLVTSMVSAYERGEPWLGYYWEPEWVIGTLDLTLLEEPAYDPEVWEESFGTAYPPGTVYISANAEFADAYPDVVEFLGNYTTSLDENNEFLAYMEAERASVEETAMWFLFSFEDTWTQWLPSDVVSAVQEALSEVSL